MNIREKNELLELITRYCEEHGTDKTLTLSYLKAICERKQVKNILSFCKSCLERMNDEEIEQLTIHKKYFESIYFKGFEQDEFNRLLLLAIENHCINEFPNITYEELNELNVKMAQYCREKGETQYSKLVVYVQKSKLLCNCNIPISILEKKVMEEIKEWNELIEEIQKSEVVTNGND